jgi:predicted nucleotide-binding protein
MGMLRSKEEHAILDLRRLEQLPDRSCRCIFVHQTTSLHPCRPTSSFRTTSAISKGALMLGRFEGDDGARRIRAALLEQSLVAHDATVGEELVEGVDIKSFASGQVLMTQGSQEMDLYFILAGSVVVEVNGREVSRRRAGEHVGEMALIDTAARRSATVRALEETVTAVVSENRFIEVADKHPRLWHRLSLELARRLRELSAVIPPSNPTPVVFVGSSTEQLPIARAIQSACQKDPWITRVWTDGVFGPGKTPLESLAAQVSTIDFGLVVVAGDDLVESRGTVRAAPRDNMLFEIGLLVGALGRERALMVRLQNDTGLKIPSDLLGVRALEVMAGRPEDLLSRVAPSIEELRLLVRRLGRR